MGSNKEDVIELLRACLLSAKGGIPVTKVPSDYRSLAGEPLPFRQLGFSSVRDFLRSVPGLRIVTHGNEEMLEAIPTKNTQHLAAMVAKQKSSSGSRRARPRSGAPRRIAPNSWKPPAPRIPNRPRSSGFNMHEPLSITLSNNYNSMSGKSYEKPTRLVSYASSTRSVNSWSSQLASQSRLSPTGGMHSSSSSSSSVASDDGAGGGRRLKSVVVKVNNNREPRNEMSNGDKYNNDKYNNDTKPVPYTKYKYEVPPRLQKLPTMTSAKKPVMLHHTEQPLIDETPPVERLPEMPAPQTGKQHAQSRLQAMSLPKLDLSKAVNYEPIASTFERTITSPMTPLQARLTAVVKKQQPVSVDHLAEQFKEAAIKKNNSSIFQLEEFAKEKNWSKPEYKVNITKTKDGPLVNCGFISCVKVEDFRYSGYPEEAPTPEMAKEIAAKRALLELTTMYSGVGGKGSADPNTVMSRVTEIVHHHPSGIWSTSIPAEYLEDYHENLPDNWLEIIDGCPLLTLEYVSDKRVIVVPNLDNPVDVQALASNLPSSNIEPLQNHKKQSVLQLPGAVVPEPLKLPQEDVWDIFVTFASTTTEVWARLLGDEYSGLYDNISLDMELHYAGKDTTVTNPKEGLFYAAKIDDCWYRCELLQIEDKVAKVFFIDHGDEEVVPVENLHALERQFGSLPAQAVKLSLRGLESFANDPNVSVHIGEIIGKTLVAQVYERPNEATDAVSVTIYDTSTDDDINMNTVLLEAIGNDALAPQLPPENHVKEVYVSHVTPTGDVYVRLETLAHLESMMVNFLENNVDILNTTSTGTPDPSQIYLAPYSVDSNFYRASVTKMLDNNRVEVFFVDYGNSEVVDLSSLVPLYVLKKSLAQFPHQVLKVHLHNVPSSMFSLQMADRLRQLVPTGSPVLLKVVQSKGPTGVPVVELFKRIQPDNILASINNTLALDPELTLGTSADTVRSYAEQKSSWSPNCDINAILPTPEIPAVGEYFDVRVSMAANPGNFTVQPHKDCRLLEKMMHEMQEEYKSNTYPLLEQNTIHAQGLYAALHTDGNWYRICVQAVMKNNMVSVYLCDFGELFVLSSDRLRALHNRFRQLPYQAIKAKLADIRPCHLDWSVEDCLVFQDMVVEREFVSIIRDTSLDDKNVCSAVIGLTLIDVSEENDVFIHERLIEQKRALPISSKA